MTTRYTEAFKEQAVEKVLQRGHKTINSIADELNVNHYTLKNWLRAYLASRPGRFVYVHTPKHGSWLNLIECAFSKMARTFLRHIRVASIDELKQRILKGIEEFNESPVQFKWTKFDLEIT